MWQDYNTWQDYMWQDYIGQDYMWQDYNTNEYMLSEIKINPDIRRIQRQGKSVPLQAWSGPEGSRKLRFPDFMTTAQDGGKVVSLMHRPPLPPGNTPGTYFC